MPQCGQTKELNPIFWHVDNHRRDGFAGICKECRSLARVMERGPTGVVLAHASPSTDAVLLPRLRRLESLHRRCFITDGRSVWRFDQWQQPVGSYDEFLEQHHPNIYRLNGERYTHADAE